MPEIDKILQISKKYNLKVVEDSAEYLAHTITIRFQVLLEIFLFLVFTELRP